MLCEALCASDGDIAVVVPATLLRLLSPLLERHGDGAAGAREGFGQGGKGRYVGNNAGWCKTWSRQRQTRLGMSMRSQKRVSMFVGCVVAGVCISLVPEVPRQIQNPSTGSIDSCEGWCSRRRRKEGGGLFLGQCSGDRVSWKRCWRSETGLDGVHGLDCGRRRSVSSEVGTVKAACNKQARSSKQSRLQSQSQSNQGRT